MSKCLAYICNRCLQVTAQWCAGSAECLRCGCEWVAVWPLGADSLECPDCGETDTVREAGADYAEEWVM